MGCDHGPWPMTLYLLLQLSALAIWVPYKSCSWSC